MADERTSQLESMQPQASALHTRPPATLHDLPPELLDHIMSFLPPGSIPDLMLNRKLRFACESRLYRDIYMSASLGGSLQLLNTFALRPDLALLVRTLHLKFAWCSTGAEDRYNVAHLLQPDGVAPLASAKNVRSLGLGGLAWVSLPSLAHVREVVSYMELTSLLIINGNYTIPNDAEASEMFISNLRSTLRSQPKLEDLELSCYPTQVALFHRIEAADVPSLNRIRADAQLVRPFLNVASKLSTIYMTIYYDDTPGSIFRQQWNGNNIKDLSILTPFSDVDDWASFGCFLGCFPNSASLTLLSLDWFGGEGPYSLYYDEIAPQLHVLTSLQKLEIRASVSKPRADPGPTPEDVLKFKTYCPSLERFVDTNEREWVYIPSGGDGGGFRAQLEEVGS